MFYVGASSILKVQGGLKIDEISDVFGKGQKVQLWEALFEFLWIFGVRMGDRWAPFWRKKASFLRSVFLMIFGVREPFTFGGVGGRGGATGNEEFL